MNKNVKTLQETLAVLQRDNEKLKLSLTHANLLLGVLKDLLTLKPEADPFPIVFDSLAKVFAFSHVMVLSENVTGQLECIAARPAELLGIRLQYSHFFHKVLNGKAAAACRNADIPEWQQLIERGNLPELAQAQSGLFLPIMVRAQRGMLIMLRLAGEGCFDHHHVALGQHFTLPVSHALAVRFEQELTQFAYYDQLTDLANSVLLQQSISNAIRQDVQSGKPEDNFACVILDLNRFKQINDYYGHQVGDKVLKQCGARIQRLLQSSAIVGRVSGDEFMLMIHQAADMIALRTTVEQIFREIQRPFMVDGHEIFSSCAIGVSIYPEHGKDFEKLRRNASNAMYRAKTMANGGIIFFDSSLGDSSASKMELEQRLHQAIRHNEFICVLQPKINIRSATVEGFEALVRWRDEDGAVHMPGVFIGTAIEIGLIDDITNFMLQSALNAFPKLDDVYGPDTCISINISARQACDRFFMAALSNSLLRNKYANRIIFEITEDALVTTNEFRTHVLPLLVGAGIKLSIDDFGSGYSSLGMLAEIAPEELKIDRSLIANIHQQPRNQSIVRAIESLAQNFGMRLVAEGVETKAELDYLQRYTVTNMVQGYYFAQPMFFDRVLNWQPHFEQLLGYN